MNSNHDKMLNHDCEHVSTALNAVFDPIVIFKPSYEIVFSNSAADKIFIPHHSAAQSEKKCHAVLFGFSSPCATQGLPCPLPKIFETKKATQIIRTQQTAEGGTRWLKIKAVPVLDEAGEVVEIVETIHDITKHKEMEDSLQRYSRSQEELFLVSQGITSTTDLTRLYRHIVFHAKELLMFDFSTLMLLSKDKKGLIIHDTLGFSESIIDTVMAIDEAGIATHVVNIRQPQVVFDFTSEDRFAVPKLVSERNIRSALCVPLIVEDQLLGVLVGHTLQQRIFTDQEIILYGNLSNQAAIALSSATALKELKSSQERYHDLFENSLDLIQMVGPDDRILYVNKAWKNVLGYGDNEITSLSALDIIHPDKRLHCEAEFRRLYAGENVKYIETTFITKKGKSLTVEGNVSCKVSNGNRIVTQGIFRDITERKLLEHKLEKMSQTDEMTGLLNRRGFFASAIKLLALAERTGGKLFLLYADLDNMKVINDELGHAVGDDALVETAMLLQKTFRNSDTIARVGGDEFTILLTPNQTAKDKEAVLERFEANLAKLNAKKNRSYKLSISTGIVTYDAASPSTIEELVSQADTLMYENKRKKTTSLR